MVSPVPFPFALLLPAAVVGDILVGRMRLSLVEGGVVVVEVASKDKMLRYRGMKVAEYQWRLVFDGRV